MLEVSRNDFTSNFLFQPIKVFKIATYFLVTEAA